MMTEFYFQIIRMFSINKTNIYPKSCRHNKAIIQAYTNYRRTPLSSRQTGKYERDFLNDYYCD